MIDLLVAYALITAPPESKVPKCDSFTMRHAIIAVAIQLELMDPQEVKWWWNYPAITFDDRIKELRTRNKNLWDAPFVNERHRFPPMQVLDDWKSFNRAYMQNLKMQQALHWDKDWYDAAMSETQQLYHIYNTLSDAQGKWGHVPARRQALKDFRALIGMENYYSGCLPPFVPLWRFRIMD